MHSTDGYFILDCSRRATLFFDSTIRFRCFAQASDNDCLPRPLVAAYAQTTFPTLSVSLNAASEIWVVALLRNSAGISTSTEDDVLVSDVVGLVRR